MVWLSFDDDQSNKREESKYAHRDEQIPWYPFVNASFQILYRVNFERRLRRSVLPFLVYIYKHGQES